MKITTKNDFLVIEIPMKQDVICPFSNEKKGKMDNIIGIIDGDDIGFSYLIDMSYKGGAPQWTDMFFKYFGNEEDFVKICKKLNIEIYDYPICDKCFNPIYGAVTLKDGKKICSECEHK